MNQPIRYRKREGKENLGAKRLNRVISDLDYEKDYGISIDEWEVEKTYQQIKFFHGPVLEAYMDYTGETWGRCKRTLKKHFGCNKVSKDVITGKMEPEIRSLADYSMEEMSAFFERLLNHFEYDCGMVIDAKNRSKFMINQETGEYEEV